MSNIKTVTITEAAQHANVSSKTIRRWIKDGLKATLTGNAYEIDEEDLNRVAGMPQKRSRIAPKTFSEKKSVIIARKG